MGLDWVVLAYEEDGRYVDPTETIGAKRACRDDPEVVAELRRCWERGAPTPAQSKLLEKRDAQQRAHAERRRRPGHKLASFFGLVREPQFEPVPQAHESFEAYLDEVLASEVPPIVINFGKGCEDAVPVWQAYAQYYGFRAKALDSNNLITEFGEARGVESSWMWGDMEDQSEIEAAIARLEQLIEALKAAKPDEFKAAEERLRRVRDAKDPEERERLDLEMGVFPEDFLGQYTAEEMSAVQRRARESGGQLARDLEAYYGAIKWLRFWSDKGFKIAADF